MALRKERNLTQEELVERSHVSVRTIQRIEAGEVLPRMSTVKILLEALGESYDSFLANQMKVMETQKATLPQANQNTLLVAVLAGVVYLVTQIILGAMDVAWFVTERAWGFNLQAIYIGLTAIMLVAYVLFARGFIALSDVFENTLLKVVSYMFIVGMVGMGILNVTTLSAKNFETLWFPYAIAAVMLGALGIVFGVALIRLQDGMGVLSRVAGILEIVMGCMMITVILLFLTYVILIPAVVLEILVLYRGYEYLSRPQQNNVE